MILRLVRFWNKGQKHEVIKYKETIKESFVIGISHPVNVCRSCIC